MDTLGFDAFETSVKLPVKLPDVCGAKATLKDTLCPAVKVTGTLNPEMLKPAPATVACVMVRLDPPVLLSVSERVCVVPACTLPKLTLEGALSVPCVEFCSP